MFTFRTYSLLHYSFTLYCFFVFVCICSSFFPSRLTCLPCLSCTSCCRYQSDSAELGQWLSSALDRLEFWSTQSVTVPQELETVRDHLHAFLVKTFSEMSRALSREGFLLIRNRRNFYDTVVKTYSASDPSMSPVFRNSLKKWTLNRPCARLS